MNISKKRRNEIYIKALEHYVARVKAHPKYYLFGLCRALSNACEILHVPYTSYRYDIVEANFPEIFKHKPKRMYGEYWFGRTTKIVYKSE